MEKTYKIEKIAEGFKVILCATGNVVAEYNEKGHPTKIVDWLNMPIQEYVEAVASTY